MKTKLRYLLILLLTFKCATSFSQNYREYYLNSIHADSVYFVEGKCNNALELYKKVIEAYDFVWIEDCIKYAQLALINKNENLAIFFFKRAIDNGLEIDLLKYLNLGCSCNYFRDLKCENHILNDFVYRNHKLLSEYYSHARLSYLQRINISILKQVYQMHVTEETYKVNYVGSNKNSNRQNKEFEEICHQNFRFLVDSFFEKNKFIGEKNIGRYSPSLVQELKIDNYNLEFLTKREYAILNLEYSKSKTPVVKESDFFQSTPLFLIFILSQNEFIKIFEKYFDQILEGGFLHPREIAYIFYKLDKSKEICLWPSMFNTKSTLALERNRKKFLLPTLELDRIKHAYSHKNDIQLFFGHLGVCK